MNNTRMKFRKQVKRSFICVPRVPIIQNVLKFFHSRSVSFRNIFEILSDLSNKYHSVHPTQEYLGRYAGCSREQANRIIGDMEELGLINRVTRYKKSCIYALSHFFKSPEIRRQLSSLFRSMRYIPLSFALYSALYGPDVTLNKGRDIYNNHLYIERGTSMTKNIPNGFANMQRKAAVVSKVSATGEKKETFEEKESESTTEKMKNQPIRDEIRFLQYKLDVMRIQRQQEEKAARQSVEREKEEISRAKRNRELKEKLLEVLASEASIYRKDLCKQMLKNLE